MLAERYEECAGCGQYHQLLWNGLIWLQQSHDCDKEKEHALRFDHTQPS